MTNNKLTNIQLAVKCEMERYRDLEKSGLKNAYPSRILFEAINRELAELQELRRNYLALRGEIEDVRSQLYEAENQANEYASELQELRKADSAEPIYQLFDAGWYDTNKSTYDTVTGTGMKGRIVYAAPQPLTNIESVEKVHE